MERTERRNGGDEMELGRRRSGGREETKRRKVGGEMQEGRVQNRGKDGTKEKTGQKGGRDEMKCRMYNMERRKGGKGRG